jgi:hypothetical protein
MKIMKIRFFLFRAIPLLILIFCCGCEEAATVSIDGNNPPTFNLSGNGTPYYIVVGEETGKQEKEWPSNVVWKIEPKKDCPPHGVWSLSPLKYGVAPKYYIQTYPKEGAASALQEGKTYYFSVPTYNAQGTGMLFIVKGNKTIFVGK